MSEIVVVLREMEDQVGHPQVLAVLAIAPTTIAALSAPSSTDFKVDADLHPVS